MAKKKSGGGDRADRLKSKLTRARPAAAPLRLSTGSAVLNMALSGDTGYGLTAGHQYNFVGDSESGKTFLALTAFAEAAANPAFRDYRLIYNNPEDGALMNRELYFGAAVPARLEEVSTPILEECYYHLDDAVRDGRPFVYVIDSMDALTPQADIDKFEEAKKASRKGAEVSGSFGVAKARANSGNLPRIVSGLKRTGSILIVICQTRTNLGFGSQFNPKVYSGGKSIRFYATAEVWTAVRSKLTAKHLGKERELGIRIQAAVKKNRESGQHPRVELRFYADHGIDDIGSCFDYLVDEGRVSGWSSPREGEVVAPDFDFAGGEDDLAERIEAGGWDTLHAAVARVWAEIKAATAVRRRRKYQ